jgi:ABC-2 type transport system ATP-binding protein
MQLDITAVSKVYRSGITAVRDVSMRLGPGVLGLLGPNGAGKSSLMRILATVTRPSHGTVTWNGTDIVAHPDELRRVLGYLPQDFGLYPHLTAPEMLSYLAAVKGLSGRSARLRVDELLAMVNLTEARKRPLGKYSGGMRQRVGIAQALLADPQVLIVDEPTAGLDPEERMRIRDLLGDLAVDRVVILSTHIVSDVEAVAEDIAILAAGRLCRRGTPEELLRDVRGQVWDVLVGPGDLPAFRERHVVSRAVRTPDGTRARVLSTDRPAVDATAVEPDLQDAYLWVVRGKAQGHGHAQGQGQGQAQPAGNDARGGVR